MISSVTFGSKTDEKLHRFIVKTDLSIQTVVVVESCSVENKRPIKSVERFDEDGNLVRCTNDITNVISNDPTSMGVMNYLQQALPKELNVKNIKTT